MEEKIEELREKYSQALRDGETDKATSHYWEIQELKGNVEEEESYDFEQLEGVGPELANELSREFGSREELADASKEELEPIPGIGEARAESLLEQVSE